MNILILHNAYQHRGGEDTVVDAEAKLLRDAGHQVHVEIVSNEQISTPFDKARVFLNTPYDPARKAWMQALCRRTEAEVVHIHNFFPLLTPAVHEAAAAMGLPVVQTLHNYRLLCANAMFLRDGHVCEKCLTGSRLWGAAYRCYKGSLPGSLALVRMQERAARHRTWSRHVTRFIALTEFAKTKFVEGGLPADRITVKPNFVADPGQASAERGGALFVGRLSPEKGVSVLLQAWTSLPDIPLTIVGDGPEQQQLTAAAPPNVTFAGRQTSEQVRSHMNNAAMLVMPSVWYEGFPMTVVEAFSQRLPVLASQIGSLAEVIDDGRSGAHFTAGDAGDLALKAWALLSDRPRLAALGAAARADYESRYTPAANLIALTSIYEEAKKAAQAS